MTLTGPDRDEVFQWDPNEPELMKAMILAGVQIQMPIEPLIKEMTPLESFCASCPHIGDCDISGSERAMKCPYVVRAGVNE